MTYTINKTNGTVLTTVEDGTVDTKYGVKLIGKNYAGYGEIQNENFVALMENFSSNSAPSNPVSGQLWYKTDERQLRVYNSVTNSWKPLAVEIADDQTPSSSNVGDLFWHTVNKQLSVYDGSQYIVIGPQSVATKGVTQMRSRSVADVQDNLYAVIEAVVDGEVVYVISPEEFEVKSTDALYAAFGTIKAGINLPYTDQNGITDPLSTSNKFVGTATSALGLIQDGELKTVADIIEQAGQGAFGDSGITIGAQKLKIYIDNDGNTGVIQNALASRIVFKTTFSGDKTPLTLEGVNVLPGTAGITNLGNNTTRFNTVYASTFDGVAKFSDALKLGASYLPASKNTDANTIAARDQNGDIFANYFQGIATSAQYADLAEKYLADAAYAPGTVISVGGEQEVTAAPKGEKVIGVVSTNPAYLMNSELTGEHVVSIALKGRVPVKVRGEVKKGDELISSGDGFAEALSGPTISKAHFHVFAVALSSNAGGETTVEAVIL